MGEQLVALAIYAIGLTAGLAVGFWHWGRRARPPGGAPAAGLSLWEDHDARLRRLEELARLPAEGTLARQIAALWKRARR
jgi:hypothetical protein